MTDLIQGISISMLGIACILNSITIRCLTRRLDEVSRRQFEDLGEVVKYLEEMDGKR